MRICPFWHILTSVSPKDKPLVWLHGEVRTPPLSREGRLEMGFLLRRLQKGESLGLPHSRPMPTVGTRCHELRVNDSSGQWRLMYRIDRDAILILDVFQKKTPRTPLTAIAACQRRAKEYDSAAK